MYRDPKFNNQVIASRFDEVLFEAENEATCWVKVCKTDCINVSLHPAELVANSDCQPPFDKFPIPSCETYEPHTEVCIQALDTKIVGTGSCIVLERKIGKCGATEVCRWDFTKDPEVDGVPQWADNIVGGRDGLMRLRVLRYDGCPVFARLHVSRTEMELVRPVKC